MTVHRLRRLLWSEKLDHRQEESARSPREAEDSILQDESLP